MVTVATGTEQTVTRAPASTTVITAQDIEMMGAHNLDEVLESVPGIHISLSELRFAPLYNVRGMFSSNNYEILMMVDGVPIKSVVDGMRGSRRESWTPPPVQYIQRIEVIRGPGSTLYGADAVAGVVNIITKRAEDIQKPEAGLRIASNQTYDTWALHTSRYKGFGIGLSVDYLTTDGHRETVYEDMQTKLDASGSTHLSQTPGRAYLQKRQLSLNSTITKGDWRLGLSAVKTRNAGAGLGEPLIISPEEYYETDHYQVDLTYHNLDFTKNWETKLQLSYRDLADEGFSAYTVRPSGVRNQSVYPYGSPNNTGYFQRQAHFNLSGQYDGFKNHHILVGIGYVYADLYKTTWSFLLTRDDPLIVDSKSIGYFLLPENIRENRSFVLQDAWQLTPNLELTTGLRYDWYSDFDSATNPRIALVWQANPNLTTKLLYGQAFRAPSFVEMYTPMNRIEVGNPNLQAESSTTWELIFDYKLNQDVHLGLNLFDYKVKDKIQRRLVTFEDRTIYRHENIGTLRGQGFELEGQWKINSKSTLQANYAYVSVEDSDGFEAGNYPHHQVYLRYDWFFHNDWLLNTRLNWVADRSRPVGDDRAELADYTELDMTLRYAPRQQHWNISLGVRNLLDEDRREPGDPRLIGDYPKAGREWFGEFRYRF
ncbi:TonB-dependent receptor [Candidatus Albibeggiatoa sp. nov. NOAA]|uniref:TonB-dependent receptor plug domain-containing protein n=1 Tax=Candidatus Albibeggiatoa sp. nov. NOAA TaxID=3162724 RepID=UPI0032F771B9|nr:TonB-dependent receptor [Thiotrichaceae bacterium]